MPKAGDDPGQGGNTDVRKLGFTSTNRFGADPHRRDQTRREPREERADQGS